MNEELMKRIDEAIIRNRADKTEIIDILHKVKDQLESKGKSDYERGMNDIWEALKECWRDTNAIITVYRCATLSTVLTLYSPQDFLAKYEEYKKKEKEEKEFRVGDEVKGAGETGVITRISSKDKSAYVLWDDGSGGKWALKDLEKTGNRTTTITIGDKRGE